MIINDDILRRDSIQLLKQIETQIEEVQKQAKQMGVSVYELRNSNGEWPMIPLLLAKTQAYSMLISLQKK